MTSLLPGLPGEAGPVWRPAHCARSNIGPGGAASRTTPKRYRGSR